MKYDVAIISAGPVELIEAFDKILTILPENGCYRNFIYNIIKRKFRPCFHIYG